MRKFMKVLVPVSLLALVMIAGCDKGPVEPGNAPLTMNYALPPGATVQSAHVYIYVAAYTNNYVHAHRVTSAWGEMTVTWNNFGGAFDATQIGGYTADGTGYRWADVTSLVQDWLDGTYPNYGLLLDEDDDQTPRTVYHSSEAPENVPPFLEICYTVNGGPQVCDTVYTMADVYITQYDPDLNFGSDVKLYTGRPYLEGPVEKQTLLYFELETTPPEEGCTRTPGYWKTHAGFGPQENVLGQYLPIWLGTGSGASIYVDDEQTAVELLSRSWGSSSNGILKLYSHLLAAKLNMAAGASGDDLGTAVADADAFLAMYDWEDWGSLSRTQRNQVLMWHNLFDDYNNGCIGPGHCEDDPYAVPCE